MEKIIRQILIMPMTITRTMKTEMVRGQIDEVDERGKKTKKILQKREKVESVFLEIYNLFYLICSLKQFLKLTEA